MPFDRDHNRPRTLPKLPGTDFIVPGGVPPARIYRAERSVTQSAPGRQRWILEFERSAFPFIEPLMGWTGSSDPFAPIRLEFPDCASAVDFAERNGWDYSVFEPPARKTTVKSYADRFKYALADAVTLARNFGQGDDSLSQQLPLSSGAGPSTSFGDAQLPSENSPATAEEAKERASRNGRRSRA
jgi:hypothetical protein